MSGGEMGRDAATRELALLRERTKALLEGLKDEKQNLDRARSDLVELQGEMHLARQRIASLKDQRRSDRDKLQNLRLRVRRLEAGGDEAPPSQEGMLRARIDSLKQQREADRGKLQWLRSRILQLECTAQPAGEVETNYLEQRVLSFKQERERANAKIARLRERLRALEGASGLDESGSEPPTAEALRQEKARSDKLLAELTRLRGRLVDIEAERQHLAGELQRATDALHDRQIAIETGQQLPAPPLISSSPPDKRDSTQPLTRPPAGPETGSTMPPSSASSAPGVKETKTQGGRPVDQLLADIDALIADSVPEE